ncbi:AfsR/SARP family transcriptional regulator [Catellatospora citrea]|uniref:SARP family transcriptional regulator n=1 Tax=Catellatospora citrea TaxID=53366 RepID=A0A8J3KK59_9ACTN|nr:BTAD domain-containing putative transcriptional regulator [Catellatospora citrea]GIG00329.1 SARP family transcriptional regulator [Catellatospora citrea]
MRVGILGPLEVHLAGEPVEVAGARLRALLIRLAVDAGRTVPVNALADALWGETLPADPANAVQTLVSRLRRALPDGAVSFGPGGYRLEIVPESVDALHFEELARRGRTALAAGHPAEAADLLGRALALWRGDALAEVADVAYAGAAAARWEELRLLAIEDRIEAELAVSAPDRVVPELERLVADQPLRERPRALLIRALHAAGRTADALAAYADFRGRLAGELGVDPSAELRQLHLAVLRDEPAARTSFTPPGTMRTAPERPGMAQTSLTPPGTTWISPEPSGMATPSGMVGASSEQPGAFVTGPPMRRDNLRTALTSFVGRAEELDRIARMLTGSRLVTLVGPGGAGKTRLSLTAAARQHADDPALRVCLVELAPVTDPVTLVQALLGALDLRESGYLDNGQPVLPRDATSRLVDALSAEDVLLVLDNCEHLVEPVATLAEELLTRCPRLRVLATTREPLNILGEALCPVSPLALPEPAASVAGALAYPVVQLLRDRAAAVRPDFAVTDDNVADVVEICRRLDGLPLAVELAAARLRFMSPAHLADRLGDRFRLLTGGSRTAMARHRTLRAVVAWSWDLLLEPERLLIERLSVFPAGATRDSAAGVCADDRVPAADVADLLDALVDKSLLQVTGDGEPRYRMLDTIREYGLERLADTDLPRVRAAHTAYFLALAEQAEPHLRGAEQLHWIRLVSAERDNMLAALHAAVDAGDADTAVRLVAALGLYWTVLGANAEAASWLGQALAVPGEAPGPQRAIATAFYLVNTANSDQPGDGTELVKEIGRLASSLDPAWDHPLLALLEPVAALLIDDTAAGLAAIDRKLAHPDPWARSMLRMSRAFISDNDGNGEAMYADLLAAVDGFRQVGERGGLSMALTALGEARSNRGDFDGAVAAITESIALTRELSGTDDTEYQQVRLAMVRGYRGEVAVAETMLAEIAEHGSTRHVCGARLGLGELARHRGDLAEATRQYGLGLAQLSDAVMASPQFRALIMTAKGHLAVAAGDLQEAAACLVEAYAGALAVKDMPVVARVGVGVADVWRARGDRARAARVLGAVEALRGSPDLASPDVLRLTAWQTADPALAAPFAEGRLLDRPGCLDAVDPHHLTP